MNKNLCLTTVTDDKFIFGTSVLLHSFLKNNKWFNGDIIIFYDELSNDSIKLLKPFRNVILSHVSQELSNCLNDVIKKFPRYKKKYRRFFSLENFRLTEYKSVLFLDSDLLVLQDVSDLFLYDGDILACPDGLGYSGLIREKKSFLKVKVEAPNKKDFFIRSFNSGFMLIGNKYLNNNTFDELLEVIYTKDWNELEMPHTDQFVLNHFFEEEIVYIPSTFNLILPKSKETISYTGLNIDEIKVIHFVGYKPWELNRAYASTQIELSRLKFIQIWYEMYFDFLKLSHLSQITKVNN